MDLHLGKSSDSQPHLADATDLKTHAVIVGMTGSGKTGLGVVLLEELRRKGVPLIIIDPKGDMTNLALTFPDFAAESFAPWCGKQAPEEVANRWKSGTANSGIDAAAYAELQKSKLSIYSPGSSAATPINLLGKMDAPKNWEDAEEDARQEINALISGLLGLAGIQSDPLSSKEHILLANLVEHAWQNGAAIDLPTLVGQTMNPPIRKLGVLPLESFFPKKEREKLSLKLNGLLASPGFSSWLEGPPLDIQSLLYDTDGSAKVSIVYMAHLSEEERQLVVSTLMGKVNTWMRGQAGSEELRACVYMDEVFGYVPPTANPPSKAPILTMLKQARAFGVGLVLSTQNPVDLDYKAMSNAGTWFIGRLQTERDKARIIEGLSTQGADTGKLATLVSELEKRQFIHHSVKRDAPVTFNTRYAMSYLAGPVAKGQLASLPNVYQPTFDSSAETKDKEAHTGAGAGSPVRPDVHQSIKQSFVSASTPWLAEVGGQSGNHDLQAGAAIRVSLRFDEKKAKINHKEEYEWVLFPLIPHADADSGVIVDFDDRDFEDVKSDATYQTPEVELGSKTYFTALQKQLKASLLSDLSKEIFFNPSLKMYSRVGESEDNFQIRCDAEAQSRGDAEVLKVREKAEKKLARIDRQLATAEQRVADAQQAASSIKSSEMISGAGSVLGVLLGGRMNSRSMARRAARSASSAASRRTRTAKANQRVESAKEKLAIKATQIDELEIELQNDITEINDKWESAAADIETIEVGLERDDVSIDDIRLFWAQPL